jgi:hypothetical protein
VSDIEFIDQFEPKEYERTLFISALCIFTWIGSWLVLLYYGLHIIKINDIERSVYHFEEFSTEFNLMKAGVVAPVISTAGSILMWRMRRIGIFIYSFGQLSLSIFGLYVYILVKPIEVPESYFFIAAFAGQIGFIALYALNYRKMK